MAQRRMLMRHMHMGIMDIIMIAYCFIALLLSSFITWKGVAMRIPNFRPLVNPF